MTGFGDFKLYRIISGVILSENKILLVQNKDEYADMLWSIPGGVIEEGESLEEALSREISEEVGLIVKDKKLIYIHESFIPEYTAHSLVTVFEVEVHDGIANPDDPDKEIVQVKWVPISEINQYIKNPSVLKPLKDWLETRMTFYSIDKEMVWNTREE